MTPEIGIGRIKARIRSRKTIYERANRSFETHGAGASDRPIKRLKKGDDQAIPLIRPNPPRLSTLTEELLEIENSGIYSNYGPVNARLEKRFILDIFQGKGTCVTVANATLGLMLAIKHAVGWKPKGRYALMPSFTFAAAAHAAMWCGLTPLFCDIDPETWLPDIAVEKALLKLYGDEIALIMPNATFGNCLDLLHYNRLSADNGIPLVIDAACSLGSQTVHGEAFGVGSVHPLIFSMQATKAFATSEGGLIYCYDQELITSLRKMGNFGFGQPRSATMPGLNSKLSEIGALMALAKLEDIDAVTERRQALYELYRMLLPEITFQRATGRRTAHQVVSLLVPAQQAGRVPEIMAKLGSLGIGCGRYFVPHLAKQPFFEHNCLAGDLSATEAISARIIALPMSDFMTPKEVIQVCEIFRKVCHLSPKRIGCAELLAKVGADRLECSL